MTHDPDERPQTRGDNAPPSSAREIPPRSLDRALGLNRVLEDLFGEDQLDEQYRQKLGRYELKRSIGAGGMGRVYEAYDPQLERRIAIKLLHADVAVGERLLREGKAMARLSHPNVVAVHDVGAVEDRFFVAMELVEGTTLRGWQRKRQRRWQEVLDMYLAFGRGIVAAHGAGLVHCDLKPDNVLVGNDNRPRVTDFGIAQLGVMSPVAAGQVKTRHEPNTEESPVASRSQTRASTIIGTPQYMAPEQFLGGLLDARTDQFAFCSMLWEALYGVRPFHGHSALELANNVLDGALVPPPAKHGVPPSLRKACERGLSREPTARWDDMSELLGDLERTRVRVRRRRALSAAAGAGALTLVGLGIVELRTAALERSCQQRGTEVSTLWNSERRDALADSLGSHDAAYAKKTASEVVSALGQRAQDWSDTTVEVCRHHTIDQTWTEADQARATWCLSDRSVELEMIIEQLSDPNDAIMASAVAATSGLPSSKQCLDLERLRRMTVPPEETRAQVREAIRELARAHASDITGDEAGALEQATSVYERAKELGWAPLVAAAALQRARAGPNIEGPTSALEHAVEAYFEAIRHSELETAFHAALVAEPLEAQVTAIDARRTLWLEHARVLLEQLDAHDTLLDARHAKALGVELLDHGETTEGLAQLKRALDIFERRIGLRHPLVFSTTDKLATAEMATGEFDAAITRLDGLLTEQEALYGPDHPALFDTLYDMGAVRVEAGRSEEAQPFLERALALHKAMRVPDINLALTLSNLGGIQTSLGNLDEALAWHEQAVAVVDELELDSLRATAVLNNLGNLYLALERFDEARTVLERIVLQLNKADAPEFPNLAVAQSNLAAALLGQGHLEQAREYFQRSLEIRERILGSENPRLGMPLLGLAEIGIKERRPKEVRAVANRVIELVDGHPHFDSQRYAAELLLIIALEFEDSPRAIETMKAWVAKPGIPANERARGEAWLAERAER